MCILSLAFWSPCLGTKGLVFVLIVHLFVSYAYVTLCHFFSSSWCRGLAAASACGSSWTFLFSSLHQMRKVIRAFCWHQHLSPSGCLPLSCPGAIYMYKNIKIYTRTRCQVSVYRTTGPLVYFYFMVQLDRDIVMTIAWKLQNILRSLTKVCYGYSVIGYY